MCPFLRARYWPWLICSIFLHGLPIDTLLGQHSTCYWVAGTDLPLFKKCSLYLRSESSLHLVHENWLCGPSPLGGQIMQHLEKLLSILYHKLLRKHVMYNEWTVVCSQDIVTYRAGWHPDLGFGFELGFSRVGFSVAVTRLVELWTT